ncbi:class V chitinase CHIT5b-like [Neltuma alba]|uniref:class V chitinase CHIT5b-like n=1 Tax=Neltuma alba TaxID=207710 RepID=UPI0010A44AC7|nr:class V chitinase CHIT5b-like [Prosopis alba]
MAAIINFTNFLLIAVLLAVTSRSTTALSNSTSVVKAAYWFEQSIFPASAINSSLYTHIYYAFLVPNSITYKLQVSNSTAESLSRFTSSLSTKTPPLKTLLSIGGAGSNRAVFAKIASNHTSRETFINSAIEVARNFGFDGLDLDWEFPQTSTEMDHLGLLLRDWRSAILDDAKSRGQPPLLLTAAMYFAVDFFLSLTARTYPVASINSNMDWINVMSYDYNGAWSNKTGPLASLFNPRSNVNTVYGLRSWIRAGLSPRKITMGIPLYGRTWELKDPNLHGIGAPAVGKGPGNGAMAYFQVEEFNRRTGARVVHDVDTVSVYSYSGTSWISYDNALTVTAKVGAAQAFGLRGYFFWAAGFDGDGKISTQASKAWIVD